MTPEKAIKTLEQMAAFQGPVIFLELADVIRGLVKQAESNVKMRSDMLADERNQDPKY